MYKILDEFSRERIWEKYTEYETNNAMDGGNASVLKILFKIYYYIDFW